MSVIYTTTDQFMTESRDTGAHSIFNMRDSLDEAFPSAGWRKPSKQGGLRSLLHDEIYQKIRCTWQWLECGWMTNFSVIQRSSENRTWRSANNTRKDERAQAPAPFILIISGLVQGMMLL